MSDQTTITTWNGVDLGDDTNRVAFQWAYERIPRLIGLKYNAIHGWVLIAIARRTKLAGGNTAWPSQKTIATEIGMKKRSVAYAIDELELGGMIKSDDVLGKSNR